MLYLSNEPVMPVAQLVATYPWIPEWAITYLAFLLNGIATASAIAAILGTFGLVTIASLVLSYVRRYGVK